MRNWLIENQRRLATFNLPVAVAQVQANESTGVAVSIWSFRRIRLYLRTRGDLTEWRGHIPGRVREMVNQRFFGFAEGVA